MAILWRHRIRSVLVTSMKKKESTTIPRVWKRDTAAIHFHQRPSSTLHPAMTAPQPSLRTQSLNIPPENSETAVRPLRPPLGIAIYDTTHNAHPARSARLARAVFDRTSQYRQRRDSRPDRIEVITLPLSLSLTDAERAEICARHHEKEVCSRMLMLDYGEAVSCFLPGPVMEWQYARKIFAINRLDDNDNYEVEVAAWEESLNEAESIVEEKARWNPQASPGSFLTIEWQPRKDAWPFRLGSAFDPQKDREMVEYCYGLEALGYELMEVTAANSVYYSHFVGDGVLDFLLKKARLE
ncbi:hypothetical protein GCG54_00004961 [Colletotrichum gloeosporioides]|uniref:Uncharacterized protein n=1 Tax=Colletotrichum gloeosporioides TaxID=474922 RepID=A0A8H4FJ55_COLGL|nr:uncharacterized protein GCG54_00004961 [Colletotrichum gloeosporioides]KAF3803781.1 hypothetical protein GCG54_00004961 [Colletotrichum gloeosporioides]